VQDSHILRLRPYPLLTAPYDAHSLLARSISNWLDKDNILLLRLDGSIRADARFPVVRHVVHPYRTDRVNVANVT
jgi:hypothetical protein